VSPVETQISTTADYFMENAVINVGESNGNAIYYDIIDNI
jgi:hypothetical protein